MLAVDHCNRADQPCASHARDLLRRIREHRNSYFYAVTQFINSRIGVPMVQHGLWENLEHTDENIDIFMAGGRGYGVSSIKEIRYLFAQGFKGRGTKGPAGTIHRAYE